MTYLYPAFLCLIAPLCLDVTTGNLIFITFNVSKAREWRNTCTLESPSAGRFLKRVSFSVIKFCFIVLHFCVYLYVSVLKLYTCDKNSTQNEPDY